MIHAWLHKQRRGDAFDGRTSGEACNNEEREAKECPPSLHICIFQKRLSHLRDQLVGDGPALPLLEHVNVLPAARVT